MLLCGIHTGVLIYRLVRFAMRLVADSGVWVAVWELNNVPRLFSSARPFCRCLASCAFRSNCFTVLLSSMISQFCFSFFFSNFLSYLGPPPLLVLPLAFYPAWCPWHRAAALVHRAAALAVRNPA